MSIVCFQSIIIMMTMAGTASAKPCWEPAQWQVLFILRLFHSDSAFQQPHKETEAWRHSVGRSRSQHLSVLVRDQPLSPYPSSSHCPAAHPSLQGHHSKRSPEKQLTAKGSRNWNTGSLMIQSRIFKLVWFCCQMGLNMCEMSVPVDGHTEPVTEPHSVLANVSCNTSQDLSKRNLGLP